MIITKTEYIKSFGKSSDYKASPLTEIAIAGRSNVGKSSLINMITGNSRLARVSSTPGKTRCINVFLINARFLLMDLPGYGFARVSDAERQRWDELMEGYLNISPMLRHVLLLLDVRHDPTEDDLLMLKWLYSRSIPFTLIATKVDKLSKVQLTSRLKILGVKCGVLTDMIIPASSETKQGKDKILELFGRAVG